MSERPDIYRDERLTVPMLHDASDAHEDGGRGRLTVVSAMAREILRLRAERERCTCWDDALRASGEDMMPTEGDR